jgi:hypothetical protein
MATILYSFSM